MKISTKKLDKILKKHKLWIENKNGGESADLSGADLSGVDLTHADLRDAYLRGAVLSGAVLPGAVLTGAVLSGADLTGTDLRGVVLRGAVLSGAVLAGANITGADLTGADLRGAYLTGAYLFSTNIRYAIGNRKEIFNILHIPEHHITYTKDVLAIDCDQHTWEEWESFSDKEIDKMGEDALELWKKYKQHIFEMKQISFGEEEK